MSIPGLLAKGQTATQIVKHIGVDGIVLEVPEFNKGADNAVICHELLDAAWKEVGSTRTSTFTPNQKCELLSVWADVLKSLDEEEVFASKLSSMIEIYCDQKEYESAAKAYYRLPHPRSDFLPDTLTDEDYDGLVKAIERVGVLTGLSSTNEVGHVLLHSLLHRRPELQGAKTHFEMILSVYEKSRRRGSDGGMSEMRGALSQRAKVSSWVPVVCVPTPHVLIAGKQRGNEALRSVAANPMTAFAGSMEGAVKIVDLETGKLIGQHKDYTQGVSCVRILEETNIVTASYDNKVRVFDSKNPGKTIFKFSGHTDLVRCVAVNPENLNLVASCSIDETVRIWDIRQPKEEVTRLKHDDAVISLAFAGPFLMAGSADGSLFGWENDTLTKRMNLGNGILDIHPLPDVANNGLILCGCQNGMMYNVISARESATPVLTFHQEDVTAILTTQHAPGLVITGSSDDCIRICFQDRCAVVVAGHSGGVSGLAVAADDGTRTVFVSSGGDGDLRVWGFDIVKAEQ
eukprot:PhF_6_TR30718/c0_g1_i1/m.45204